MNFIHLLDFPSRKNLFKVPHSFLYLEMGVKNLWDILESCKKTLPLYHLQWVSHIFSVSKHTLYLFIYFFFLKKNYFCLPWICGRNKRVCIDLSCWMVQLQNVNKSHASIKDKLYLKGLFHRLRALIALNCSLIFVTGMCIFHFGCLQFWLQM